MRRAVFCIICIVFEFVSDMEGDHMSFAYLSVRRVMVCRFFNRVSFVVPQFAVVSAYRIFREFFLLCVLCSVC